MMSVEFRETADEKWAHLQPVVIGQGAPAPRTSTVHALVRYGEEAVLRVDIHATVDDPFREAIVWGSFVVIAFGDRVHFVSIPNRIVITHSVKTYVGHFYAVAGRLIVTDAERIHCFDHVATLLWKSIPLGAHGVLVQRIGTDRIEGHGEWAAPHGWQSFKIHLWSGMLFERGVAGQRLTA